MNQSISCPCNCGTIKYKAVCDNHNRIKTQILIHCPHCAVKYKAEQAPQSDWKVEGYADYRLVPADYPPYTGYRAVSDFPAIEHSREGHHPLIETYPKHALWDAYSQMGEVKGIRQLSGTASRIVSDFRRTGAHVSLVAVRRWVKHALDEYEAYPHGTYDDRAQAAKREKDEIEMYEREKRKVCIPLGFSSGMIV